MRSVRELTGEKFWMPRTAIHEGKIPSEGGGHFSKKIKERRRNF